MTNENEETGTEVATMSAADRAMEAYMAGDANPFVQYADNAGVSDAEGFLRFSGNTGEWTVRDDVLGDLTLFAFNVLTCRMGYIGWSNGKPIKKILEPMLGGNPLPAEHELQPIEKFKEMDGWQRVVVIDVRDMEMEYGQMEVSLPAENGYRPVNKLVKEFGVEGKKHIDPDTRRPMIPVIEISSESFDSKGGTKYAPILKIVDWVPEAELEELAQAAEGDAAETEGETEAPKEAAKKDVENKSAKDKAAAGTRGNFRAQRRGAKA